METKTVTVPLDRADDEIALRARFGWRLAASQRVPGGPVAREAAASGNPDRLLSSAPITLERAATRDLVLERPPGSTMVRLAALESRYLQERERLAAGRLSPKERGVVVAYAIVGLLASAAATALASLSAAAWFFWAAALAVVALLVAGAIALWRRFLRGRQARLAAILADADQVRAQGA